MGTRFWIALVFILLNTTTAAEELTTCCTFPLRTRPTESYLNEPRSFRAPRESGRLHSACDLYQLDEGEEILAIDSGKVIRGPYLFYQGTYAIEVKHRSGYIVRYGEINATKVSGIETGAKVAKGQVIGYMGKVNSDCCSPMLNFEMFSGKASGPLTQNRKPFQRRKDLINPTRYLQKWEQQKFGDHYFQRSFHQEQPVVVTNRGITAIHQSVTTNEIQRALALIIGAALNSDGLYKILAELRSKDLIVDLNIENSEETGSMFTLDATPSKTSELLKWHVQFFGDLLKKKTPMLQHFSVETSVPLESLRANLDAIAAQKTSPQIAKNGFEQWTLPNGYVLWMARTANTITVAVELTP